MSITSFLPTRGIGLPTRGAGLPAGTGRVAPARVRTALRAGTVAALTSAPLLAAGAALAASNTYDGEDSGPGLSILQTIGIFVCIPVGLFLLITFLVLAPGWIKGDSHRREVGWSGQTQPAGAGATAVATAGAAKGPGAAAKKAANPSSSQDVTDKVATNSGAGAHTGGASGTWQS